MNEEYYNNVIEKGFAPIGTDESENIDEINAHRSDGAKWFLNKFFIPRIAWLTRELSLVKLSNVALLAANKKYKTEKINRRKSLATKSNKK